MKRKFSIALSLAVIVSILLTPLALASTVDVAVVDVSVPLDAVTLTAGSSGPITINLTVTGKQDGTATFEVYRDWKLSGGIFAGSNPQEFTVGRRAAGDPATTFSTVGMVSVAPAQPAGGPFTVTISVFDITNTNATGAKLSAGSSDTYRVTVSAPPPPSNTPPGVSLTGVTDGLSYAKGFVPAAICQVTDAEDGNSSFAATLSAISGPYASDGLGSQTASCSHTDAGGLTANASATYNIVDPSAPGVSYTLSPAPSDGNNGWYKSSVTLTWSVSEPESPGSLQKVGCVDQNIEADQPEASYSCSATSAGGSSGTVTVSIKRDGTVPSISATRTPPANSNGWNNSAVTATYEASDALSGLVSAATGSFLFDQEGAGQSHAFTVEDAAGNSASATVDGVNIDLTAPSASASASPAANANGWNNADVSVSFSGSDSLSGIDFCDTAVVLSSEGAGQSASGTCTDKAGNVSSPATATVSIDKTAPTVALVGGPANGASYYFGFVPGAPTCSASDGLSGLDGSCSVPGYGSAVGPHTVTASATDKAGNSASASASYTVLAWTLKGFYQPVDGNGVLNVAKNGSTVPLKFGVFAGNTELTDVAFIKQTFVQTLSCGSGTTDDIESYATGGTSLRYDPTGGQFIFNWQTPKTPGACYKVTLTTKDGQSISASFKLK